jgi:hypothetical protein
MTGKQRWRELCNDSSSGKSATDLHNIVASIAIDAFFQRAGQLQELVDPIMNAIHQLEADRPLLSQMLPVVHERHLERHAAVFAEEWPDLSTTYLTEKQLATTIIGIFNRLLRDLIYQPC